MKDSSYRIFTIERGSGRSPLKFAVRTRPDSAVQVTRVSPYDETEYHWALKSAGRSHWRIIRNGKAIASVGDIDGGALTPEQIAHFLIEADRKAGLEPIAGSR